MWKNWLIEWMQQFHKEDVRDLMNSYSTPAGLAELKRKAGLDYLVILAELNFTGTITNDYVVKLASQVEGVLAFANINPTIEPNPAGLLERLVKEYNVKGLKMLPTYHHFYINDTRLYPLYAMAQKLQVPVLFHTGSSEFPASRMKYGQPIYLDDVARDFPNLILIMAHSGRGCWYHEAFFLARHHPNIYMEISGLPPKNLLHYFPELEKISHKVIFGSDWPAVNNIAANIEQVRRLPLSAKAKEAILGNNAARILGLKS
jgi:predicted TIM-barrel fold metal-dependent hydrolase